MLYVAMETLTIVIGTCDKYAACWNPMIHSLQKYWADRLWNVVFITNEIDIASYRTICVGKDESWGSTIIKGLNEVTTPYILWLMDDMWITGPVETTIIRKYLEILVDNKLHHIRLLPPAYDDGKVVPSRECKERSKYHMNLWHFYNDAEFKISATAGLWNTEVFKSYLRAGMTPWQFEKENRYKNLRDTDKYLCNINPYVFPTGWYCNPYPNGKNSFMSRGHWDTPAYEYAKYEDINIDFSIHPNGDKNENFPK